MASDKGLSCKGTAITSRSLPNDRRINVDIFRRHSGPEEAPGSASVPQSHAYVCICTFLRLRIPRLSPRPAPDFVDGWRTALGRLAARRRRPVVR